MDTSAGQYLREGIAAAKAGQRQTARSLLIRVTEATPDNITAWLWLSGVMDTPQEQERCLQQVLTLDPEHAVARRGLAALQPRIIDDLLMQGIAAAEIGKKIQARDLLLQVTDRDEGNVLAWLWLSRVVESFEDRQLCLENVLALAPQHAEARDELAALQRQHTPEPVTSPVEIIEAEPPSPEELAWQSAWTRYDNSYGCPTCAAQTALEDKRCATCDAPLWSKAPKREKPSTLYWVLWSLQAINVLSALAAPLLWVAQLSQRIGLEDYTLLLPLYMGGKSAFTPEAAALILQQAPRWQFWVNWIPLVLALGLFIGISVRWPPIYYLLLAEAILTVFLTLAGGVLIEGPFRWVGAGCGMIMAIALLGLTLKLQDDFIHKRKRLLLQVDRGITAGPDFLTRGMHYLEQGRWALAAIHLRRAAALMPGKPAPQVLLARACLQLRELTLARHTIELLRYMSPQLPELAELEAALKSAQETTPLE